MGLLLVALVALLAFANGSNDNSKGVAYNEAADKKSWAEMKKFFSQIFS